MRAILLLPLLSLTACIEAEPVVSDFNGDSVKIQISQLAPEAEGRALTKVEAQRICGRVGRKAEYASSRSLGDGYIAEHLFLCL